MFVVASCYQPLGMQSGAIPDSALRASSSYDDSSVGPSYGRYSAAYTISPATDSVLELDSTEHIFANASILNQK